MFARLSHDAYLHQLGVVHGLESTLGLIETIDAHARNAHEHTRTPRDEPRPDPFFGSDWFRLADALRKRAPTFGASG